MASFFILYVLAFLSCVIVALANKNTMLFFFYFREEWGYVSGQCKIYSCSKFEVLSYLTKFVSLPCLADGDPHFVVDFPLSKLTVCFNINGEPGDVLRLVTDHKHSGKPRAWIISLIIIFCTIQAFLNILSKYNDLQFQ